MRDKKENKLDLIVRKLFKGIVTIIVLMSIVEIFIINWIPSIEFIRNSIFLVIFSILLIEYFLEYKKNKWIKFCRNSITSCIGRLFLLLFLGFPLLVILGLYVMFSTTFVEKMIFQNQTFYIYEGWSGNALDVPISISSKIDYLPIRKEIITLRGIATGIKRNEPSYYGVDIYQKNNIIYANDCKIYNLEHSKVIYNKNNCF